MEKGQVVQLLLSLMYIVISLLIGFFIEKLITSKIRKALSNVESQEESKFIKSCKGSVTLIFLILGLYAAMINMPMTEAAYKTGHKLFVVLLIVSSTLIIDRVAEGLIILYSTKIQGTMPATSIFVNFTRLIVFIIGLLVLLEYLGISIAPILTALGVGGLAVALALQDTLSNLFSGLHIIAVRQFVPGEYIRLSTGEEGYVEDINWRNTTIKSTANNYIVIPNSKIAAAIITNFDRPEKEVPVVIPVEVNFKNDMDKIQQITEQAAREVMTETPGAVVGFEPVVRFNSFVDSGVKFNVILRAEDFASQFLLVHEMIKKLDYYYSKEGIELVSRGIVYRNNSQQ